MRWFEQVTSKPRCSITQFHRPAELKLETVAFFIKWHLIFRTTVRVCTDFFMQKRGEIMDAGHPDNYNSIQRANQSNCFMEQVGMTSVSVI